jgi:hypothetical protein
MFDKTPDVAQSEVIGVVLVLGITFTGISIILVTGNPTLDNTKELARTSTAENGLSLLDERVSSAALSDARKKRFSLNLQSGELNVDADGGEIRIYSSPPVQSWSKDPSPGILDANHVLNFTVESGSDVAGNDTHPRYLDTVTVRYPGSFDTSSAAGTTTGGVDTNINGSTERSLDVLGTDDTLPYNELVFDVNEADANSRLNETYLFTLEYGDSDIEQPPVPGEYPVNVTVENDNGDTVTKETTIEVGNTARRPRRQIDTTVSMGKVEYETEDFVIAYQNGGVWRKPKDEDSISRTISKPEVYYDGNTLTASVINITNAADLSLGGTPSLTATSTGTERAFPKTGTERRNPLQNRNVYIDVNTSYYNAWSEYFESETVGDVVDTDPIGDERANIVVELSPLPDTVFNRALLTRGGNVTVRNSTVDSYDSSVSDYSPAFRFGNGDIVAGGNVSLENESTSSVNLSQVYGSVVAGDRAVMENRTFVTGDLKANGYAGAPGGENITVYGSGLGCRVGGRLIAEGVIAAGTECSGSEVNSNPQERIPQPTLVDEEVNERIEEYSTTFPGSPTVSSGNYIVDSDRSLTSDITFDTTGGPINIAVNRSDQLLFTGLELEVNGTNPVRIYSGNSSTGIPVIPKVEFDDVDMDVEGNSTDLFSVLFHSTTDPDQTSMFIQGGTEFYGTVYAPDMENLEVRDSDVYGAMVAENITVVDSGIHYDQQLRDPRAEGVSAVNYLHVTDNRVRIR